MGKTVVITGASSGIGRALARAFAARKDSVALLARGRDGLAAAAREVDELGGRSLLIQVDVADRDKLENAADSVASRFGGIDVWVNDAMVSVLAPADSLTAEELIRVTDVNYLGTVYGTLAALRHMRPKNRGVVIQVGSALAYRSIPMQSAYCATKAAVRAFTDSLRSELRDARCDVRLSHLVVPATNTPQFDVIRNKLGAHAHPMGGALYQPEVVAKAALHLVEHPMRELAVGPMTIALLLGQKLFPALLDARLSKHTRTAQVTYRLPLPAHDNLFHPLPGDRGAHGAFDAEAKSSSFALWLRLHLGWVFAGLALGVLFGVTRRKRLPP